MNAFCRFLSSVCLGLGIACGGVAVAQNPTMDMPGIANLQGIRTYGCSSLGYETRNIMTGTVGNIGLLGNWDSSWSAFNIRADHNYHLALTNSGENGYQGIKIDKLGAVGIGQVDLLGAGLNGLLQAPFQFTNIEPLFFWNGGDGKRILFNTTFVYNEQTEVWEPIYISNLSGRTSSSAAMLTVNHEHNVMTMEVAQPGSANNVATMKAGLTISMAASTLGNVGIKLPFNQPAQHALDVMGEIGFRNGSPNYEYLGGFYADYEDTGIHARDRYGNNTQLSSHFDPTEIDAQAKTSFNDSKIALPYSFHHENEYIGKGQVIDMAKLVNFVEQKMKDELGDEDGKIVFDYDLDPKKVKTLDERRIELALNELSSMPLIKVDIPDDGTLPAEAIVEVDEYKDEQQTKKIKERKLDLASRKVVTVEKEVAATVKVKTGKKVNQLKAGWQFSDGQLYREPTVADLDMTKFDAKYPDLPDWVKSRMKKGQQTSLSMSQFIAEIKNRKEAMAAVASGSANL